MSDELPISNKPSSDDFIPVTENISDTTSNDSKPKQISLAEKLRLARLSMQGPERTIKRERNEREKEIETQKDQVKELLALLTKKKEDLEIAWVVLDNKRNDLKKILSPILEEEEKVELEEEELEGRERTNTDPVKRQEIEKERTKIQIKRQNLEKEKWGYEDKIFKIENSVKENTDKYQQLLDEEEGLLKDLEGLEGELSLIIEQERLEKEEAERKQELAKKEAEEKRRLEIAKLKEAEDQKLKELEKAKKLETEKQQKEVEKKKQELVKAKEPVKIAMTLKTAPKKPEATEEEKKRAIEMSLMKARGEMEMKRQQGLSSNSQPKNQNPVIGETPITIDPKMFETTNNENKVDLTPDKQNSAPTETKQPIEDLTESSDLPKLRTLKGDLEKIKQGK